MSLLASQGQGINSATERSQFPSAAGGSYSCGRASCVCEQFCDLIYSCSKGGRDGWTEGRLALILNPRGVRPNAPGFHKCDLI